jgi:hypothetical protein
MTSARPPTSAALRGDTEVPDDLALTEDIRLEA